MFLLLITIFEWKMLKSLIISPRSGLETEGLFEREEGSFNLVKIMVAVHKELECAKCKSPGT